MADELFDLVNEKDEVIGTVWKSEAHGNINLIHREVGICIFNSQGKVLIQQRAFTKKHEPGKWKITAGHIAAGEDPKTGMQRELEEELGIKVEMEFFNKIFNRSEEHQQSRFLYSYFGKYDGNKFTLQKKEVEQVKWVKPDEVSNQDEQGKINVGNISYSLIQEMYAKYFPKN